MASDFATLEYSHSGDATKRLRGCIISRRFLCHTIYYSIVIVWYLSTSALYVTRRGQACVVHSMTILFNCYLLDYQQVRENTNVSIILLGDKKEPTKWKTNPVQQILLPYNHFPCYFYFKNHFYWRKEKRCVTCLWLPTKANTQK